MSASPSDPSEAGPSGATSPNGPAASPAATPPTAMVADDPPFSPIWIVPILAAVLAAVLGWQAWGTSGTPITIHLDDGHGLKAGDVLRHRGITVGEVVSVNLDGNLGGVVAEVVLHDEAADLARVGSRFWVVRPYLGLVDVGGLDTLIGDRYLAVLPGRGPPQERFVGLPAPPVPDAFAPGLDITLEAPSRYGLSPGSPITYRRIDVGAVLGVGLASDGRTVEVAARIRAPYAQLVRRDTRFWDTSGVSLDLGITGLSLRLQTFESVLRGGLAMATPEDAGPAVRTGHRFVLAASPQSEWLEWDPALPVGHSLLPPGTPLPHLERMALTWTEGTFWSGDERREGWVLPVAGGVVSPADLLTIDEDAYEDSSRLELAGALIEAIPETTEVAPGLALMPTPEGLSLAPFAAAHQRVPAGPEDCILVGESTAAPLTLATGRFTAEDGVWVVDRALSLDDRWHGAVVLARQDGKLVGLVLVDDDGARVVPLPRALP